ncbi:PaaI family thioesterase [candidate division KSB1 bacterium]|nr:PaaI family thioesterase [candidate division KSB1 bacterium]RQW02144.1 MAG: PaaI family thioesterase [candidate division KSB1 bacterium]
MRANEEKIKSFFVENDRFAKHNGIRLVEASIGRAVVEMDVQEFHLNAANVVHGAALVTLVDFAFALACNMQGRLSLAVNITMNFVKAASHGTLRAACEEITDGKLATYQATVTDEQGDIIATFQGLAFRKNEPIPIADW